MLGTLLTLALAYLAYRLVRRYRRHHRGHPASGFDLPEMRAATLRYLRERDERRRAA